MRYMLWWAEFIFVSVEKRFTYVDIIINRMLFVNIQK